MGSHGGGLLHDSSGRYLLLSIFTIQFELRPLWTDSRPSKLRVKTPSEPKSKGHKTKTKPKFEKMARQVYDICLVYESSMIFEVSRQMREETGFEIVDFRKFDDPVTLTLTLDDLEYYSVPFVSSTSIHSTIERVEAPLSFIVNGRTFRLDDGKIFLSSGSSGIHIEGHGRGLLHGCSRKYFLISIVNIQSDLRPL